MPKVSNSISSRRRQAAAARVNKEGGAATNALNRRARVVSFDENPLASFKITDDACPASPTSTAFEKTLASYRSSSSSMGKMGGSGLLRSRQSMNLASLLSISPPAATGPQESFLSSEEGDMNGESDSCDSVWGQFVNVVPLDETDSASAPSRSCSLSSRAAVLTKSYKASHPYASVLGRRQHNGMRRSATSTFHSKQSSSEDSSPSYPSSSSLSRRKTNCLFLPSDVDTNNRLDSLCTSESSACIDDSLRRQLLAMRV